MVELREILKEPTVRADLDQLDTGTCLSQLDRLAGYIGDDDEIRMVWG